MKVLICHERFLFRFGADRFMMLIGEGLARRGHEVIFMTNRCDESVLRQFASRIIYTPFEGFPYLNISEHTENWLEANWDTLFADGSPDVVLNGDWPYCSSIPLMMRRTKGVVFMDCGVVPLAGLPEGHRAVLDKLTRLRRTYLPQASAIAPISNFLAYSQSFPDSNYEVPVRTIYCGADHMSEAMWTSELVSGQSTQDTCVARVTELNRRGHSLILALGRWETNGYKNSAAALDVLRLVRKDVPGALLLALAEAKEMAVPPDLAGAVIPLGFPDDRELQEVMKLASLGISMSLWEGFNLPLAEMQWLGKSALVFDVGAHSEVVADPWHLCRNASDMATKAVRILRDGREARATDVARFRREFRWEKAVSAYENLLEELVSSFFAGRGRSASELLIIDVTYSTKDPANPGVIRVARRLSRSLQEFTDPIFVVWDTTTNQYVLPTEQEFRVLGQFNGPVASSAARMSPAAGERRTLDDLLQRDFAQTKWLLCPETMIEDHFRTIRPYIRERDFQIGVIFYDPIPVLKPELCNEQVRDNHARYMKALAECDAVFPISQWSDRMLHELWKNWGVPQRKTYPILLPGEFGGISRNRVPAVLAPPVRILCVSTIEPRKNHRTLIEACRLAAREHPDFQFQLTLVGNRYAGAADLSAWLEDVCRTDARFRWLGIVSDADLVRLYRDSHFTVYPSIMEGYGLPIMESIWHGRPCICSQDGVMAELAAGGGCLTAEITNPQSLADAMYRLATDSDLHRKLSEEAVNRPVSQWRDYAVALLGHLRAARAAAATA